MLNLCDSFEKLGPKSACHKLAFIFMETPTYCYKFIFIKKNKTKQKEG